MIKPIKLNELFTSINNVTKPGSEILHNKQERLTNRAEKIKQNEPVDPAFLIKVKQAVTMEIPELMIRTREELEKNDPETAEKYSNSLKNIAIEIEAASLKKYIFKLQLAVRRGDIKEALRCFERMENEVNCFNI